MLQDDKLSVPARKRARVVPEELTDDGCHPKTRLADMLVSLIVNDNLSFRFVQSADLHRLLAYVATFHEPPRLPCAKTIANHAKSMASHIRTADAEEMTSLPVSIPTLRWMAHQDRLRSCGHRSSRTHISTSPHPIPRQMRSTGAAKQAVGEGVWLVSQAFSTLRCAT